MVVSYEGTIFFHLNLNNYSSSTKQKLNTKSSTESELVGIDNMMPMVLWVRYFLTSQGCYEKDNVLYQDNMSTIKLANNGKMSKDHRTRHLNMRYFVVIDQISKGEMRIEHCPTEKCLSISTLSHCKVAYFGPFGTWSWIFNQKELNILNLILFGPMWSDTLPTLHCRSVLKIIQNVNVVENMSMRSSR